MKFQWKVFSSLVFVVLAASAVIVLTQAQLPDNSAPVQMVEEFVDTTPGAAKLSFRLTNQSNKNIRGYAILAEFYDSDGSLLCDATQVRIHPPHLLHLNHSFMAGHSWTEDFKIQTKGGIVMNHTAKLDHVSFEDGTSWGPDSRHQSYKILGILQGAGGERDRLRRILKESGMQGVQKDLENVGK